MQSQTLIDTIENCLKTEQQKIQPIIAPTTTICALVEHFCNEEKVTWNKILKNEYHQLVVAQLTKKETSSELSKELKLSDILPLVHKSALIPPQGTLQIWIVAGLDLMSTKVANVFLKTLEEPPPRTLILATASSNGNILPTIMSRVMLVGYESLVEKALPENLMEGFQNYTPNNPLPLLTSVYSQKWDRELAKSWVNEARRILIPKSKHPEKLLATCVEAHALLVKTNTNAR